MESDLGLDFAFFGYRVTVKRVFNASAPPSNVAYPRIYRMARLAKGEEFLKQVDAAYRQIEYNHRHPFSTLMEDMSARKMSRDEIMKRLVEDAQRAVDQSKNLYLP